MLSSNLVPTLFACIETSDSSDPSDEKYVFTDSFSSNA